MSLRVCLQVIAVVVYLGLPCGHLLAAPEPLKDTLGLHKIWKATKWKVVQPTLAMNWSMQTWHLKNLRLSANVQIRASLRTHRKLTSLEMQQFKQNGVNFRNVQGKVLHVGSTYPIIVTKPGALAWLNQHPLVERVESRHNPFLKLAPPLEVTAKDTEASYLHMPEEGRNAITGKGVTIGLIDSGIDVHHPIFFRADGPWFKWIDTDNDKKFTIGVDGVDWNKDGKIDKDEIIQCHQARYHSSYYTPFDKPVPGECRIGQDWFYLDQNSNNKRDFGPQSGFKESDPTYGEPLFVVDDINRNGILDPGEKLISLKTSKIKSVLYRGKTYERGKNLNEVPVHPSMGGSGHGTLSSSVMVGGQPGYMKHVGLAHGAELVVGVSRGVDLSGQPISVAEEALAWLVKSKVNIILHEYSQWLGEFLDGSSNHEKAVDDAAKLGIVQVTPVGNLGNQGKHAMAEVKAGKTYSLPIQVAWPSWYPPNYPFFRQLNLSLLWRGNPAPALTFTLIVPDGTKIPFDPNNTRGKVAATNMVLYSTQTSSSRNTHLMQATILGYNSQTRQYVELPKGEWKLEVKGDAQADTLFHAYLGDDRSGWIRGIHFTQDVSNQYTSCWPSTADKGMGIGAYAGRPGEPYSYSPEKGGEIRGYSGAGPRIDEQPILWLAAPDNPLAAVSPLTERPPNNVGYGQYFVYGGTSGSSPHVAAAVALLLEKNPTWGHDEVKDAFKKGSLADTQVGPTPNKSWGYGKLRVYRTLFGKEPPTNTPPKLAYSGRTTFWMGNLPAELNVDASDQETQPEKLRIWWDLNYDGSWDQRENKATLKFPFSQEGSYLIKVRVMDEQGVHRDLLLTIEVKACENDSDCGDGMLCKDKLCSPAPGPEPEPEPEPRPEAGPELAKDASPETNSPEPGPENVGCNCQQTAMTSTSMTLFFVFGLFGLALRFRKRRFVDESGSIN